MSERWATPMSDIFKAMKMVEVECDKAFVAKCPYCGFVHTEKIALEMNCIFCKNNFSNVKRITEE